MDHRLELIVIPGSREGVLGERVGFPVDVDHRAGEDFRVIQLTPPGSACSVTLMRNAERAGAVQGLHLVVEDVEAAIADLSSRGVEVAGPFHFGERGRTPGLDPERRSYGSFASFEDPDGNAWMLQEVRR
jgi:catechol 2,3-dioxygenase-like lactoylglutathione lyase family enzyme